MWPDFGTHRYSMQYNKKYKEINTNQQKRQTTAQTSS